MEKPKHLNVGIIGFGFIGKVHAWSHQNLPWYYTEVPVTTRITHVCTSRPETAAAAKALTGAAVATTDASAVWSDPAVDLVHICTPNNLHAADIRGALGQGKRVYCDKPLTATLAEAEALLQDFPVELERSLGMTFQWRFFPSTIRAAELVESGALGRILSFRAAYLHAGSADPEAPLKWKLSAAAGGGVIADLASHVFDLLSSLGGELTRVQAQTNIAFETRPPIGARDSDERLRVDAEDYVAALCEARFPGSDAPAVGTVEASKIATGAEDDLTFEIHGTRGALRFHGMAPHYLEHYDATAASPGWTRIATGQRYGQPANGFPTPKASIGWMRSHIACLAGCLAAFARDEAPRPNGLHGVENMRVLEAVKRSAASGSGM
ncbi:MAG: Gfo/Idh/MocA family protein, partial [bacterium]